LVGTCLSFGAQRLERKWRQHALERAKDGSVNENKCRNQTSTWAYLRHTETYAEPALFISSSGLCLHLALADTRRHEMKKFAKIGLGVLLLGGAATAMASGPAEARVVVGIGVGPAYYAPPPPAPYPYYGCYGPYCGYPYPAYYGYYGPSVALGLGWGGWHGGYHGWRGGWHRR